MNKRLNKHFAAVNDDELGKVAGGKMFVVNSSGLSSCTEGFPYELLDAHGNNLYENDQKICFETYGEAVNWAWNHFEEREVISIDWDHLRWLRGDI